MEKSEQPQRLSRDDSAMRMVFVDESKAKGYLLCAVEIEADLVPTARKLVRSVRKKRQTKVHFVFESDSRKRQILQTYSKLEFRVRMFSVSGLSELEARTRCLIALASNLSGDQNYSIVFDRDVNHEVNDRRQIRQVLERRQLLQQVDYRHEEPSNEVLLWIPDAIAWTYAKGGNWRPLLRKFRVEVVSLT